MTQERRFSGSTISRELDGPRLTRQYDMVWAVMSDGEWRTLRKIANDLAWLGCSASEASISARLRDFRKARNGSHTVERERMFGGLHQYRLIPNEDSVNDDV